MSDNNYKHQLYFSESLADVFARSDALHNFSNGLKNYKWGKVNYVVCGNSTTPSDQPVIKADLLEIEISVAKGLGFKVVETSLSATPA